MLLTINDHDYTAALDNASPLRIERTLNAPSACQFSLALPEDGSLDAPARFQSISVIGDDGVVYFTGYIAATPQPEYAGLAIDGPRYRLVIQAASDEILLDQALASSSRSISGLTAGEVVRTLAAHTGLPALNMSDLTLDAPVDQFTSQPGALFSKSAGQVASQARAAYRAYCGKLTLSPIPATMHSLTESDGNLTLANLTFTRNAKRDVAEDITVCGEHEPAAYVIEIFHGDGATTTFNLSAIPYFPPSSQTSIISELFNEPSIDTRVWSNPSGNSYFAIEAPGLVMGGGTGIDGQTQLAWLDPIEMGGTLLLEAEGVMLANESTGLLAALLSGGETSESCVAGFQAIAQQGTGSVSLQPVVLGSAAGSTFAIKPGAQYTLRLRIHAPEQQRTRARYRSFGDSGLVSKGGQLVGSPAKLHFEIQEFIHGVASMPVSLYDGALANIPAACVVVAASSVNLHGSIRGLHLMQLGSAWVVSTLPNSANFTRRLGSTAQSAECSVERSGRLVFNTGFTPAAGEQVTVSYRTIARSVGRAVNSASQQTLAEAGALSTASWTGSVTSPPCRSSADCRNAAAALAETAAGSVAMWSGTYRATNLDLAADVWPGDALALNAPSCNLNADLIVRTVKLSYQATAPDLVRYEITFANDWAEDLAIRTSEAVPADAWLPAADAPSYAPNLNALSVTAVAGSAVTVNTGATAPPGGGFEIRNRDYAFMPGEDSSLVMRGSQSDLTFTRQSAADRYYIRMFDGAAPPNYSEFSAVVILNLPLSS